MTLQELKDRIDELCDTCEDPSSFDIRVAVQPAYPMQTSLQNICRQRMDNGEAGVIWLAVGDHEDYLHADKGEVWNNDEIDDTDEDADTEGDEN